jgi:general secretion pathway protein I
MRRSEDGFALIEVVVAFTIVTIILAALYQAIAGAWRGYARTDRGEQTLAHASAQLEAIGVGEPMQPGESSGSYATGAAWQLTVEPVRTASQRGRVFRLLLKVHDPAGKPLLQLETFKLDVAAN